MIGSKSSYNHLGTAISCLLAISFVFGLSCAPLCAGSSCLPQTTLVTGSKTHCHGMSGHGESSVFGAKNGPCQLADTGLAVFSKPGFSVKTNSPSTEILLTAITIQDFAASSTEVLFSNGPPRNSFPRIAPLILRV
jgi:hypothetical protein